MWGIGNVQKSQEEFGLEPFRNCVSSWQSWLSTGGRRAKHPSPGLAQSGQTSELHAVLPSVSPAQPALSLQVPLILLSWSFPEKQAGLFPKR